MRKIESVRLEIEEIKAMGGINDTTFYHVKDDRNINIFTSLDKDYSQFLVDAINEKIERDSK